MKRFAKPYYLLIALAGAIVPRRLRADWREEWDAELGHRERVLADWDRLDRAGRRELLRRSSSAFWDALWLQRHRWEDDMVQDVRFGVRLLLRSPAFAAVAISTLALGIGTNVAIFSIVNALLLRPLDGVPDPGRLVQVSRQYADRAAPSDSTYPDYLDYRSSTTVLSGLSAVVPTAFHLSARGQTERVDGELVSSDYFDVLGVGVAYGRPIVPADDREDAADVAVLSHRIWARRFGGDPSVVGSAIRLDGRNVVVVGVANERFAGTRIGAPRDIWVPLLSLRRTDPKTAARFEQRRASWLEMFGRLKPDATLDQARTELAAIAARLERDHPDTNVRARARVEPGLGRDIEVEAQLRRFAYVPFTAATIVLLIACANVAGLLLARAAPRAREIATRRALGAGRLRIVRQLLTESAVLAIAGGGAGLVVGRWLTTWLRALLPDRYLFLSFNVDFRTDWRVLTFMLAVAAATGLLFGAIPAMHASRRDVAAPLKAAHGSGRGWPGSGRAALVVGQVALSLVLLVAAGLSVRTLQNAAAIDTGYDVDRVLTARLDLAKQNYSEARGLTFHRRLLERLGAAPGVEAAAFAVTLPLNDGRWENPVTRDGDPTRVQAFQNLVSARYFEVMNIPLVAGRGFSAADDERGAGVAVVNQRLADLLWPNQQAVGNRVTFRRRTFEVVGIVRDIKGRNLFEPPGPILYLSMAQNYTSAVVLHVRAGVPTASLIPIVQREVKALDADLPIYGLRMLDEHLTATLTPQRLLAWLIGGFGVLALVLAGIGLYGVVSYTVTARTGEIGIRLALGASRTRIVGLFLLPGLRMAACGVVLGLAAASALTRLMRSVLFGVGPLDPLTVLAVSALLIIAASCACYVPARRAARANPNSALRCD